MDHLVSSHHFNNHNQVNLLRQIDIHRMVMRLMEDFPSLNISINISNISNINHINRISSINRISHTNNISNINSINHQHLHRQHSKSLLLKLHQLHKDKLQPGRFQMHHHLNIHKVRYGNSKQTRCFAVKLFSTKCTMDFIRYLLFIEILQIF